MLPARRRIHGTATLLSSHYGALVRVALMEAGPSGLQTRQQLVCRPDGPAPRRSPAESRPHLAVTPKDSPVLRILAGPVVAAPFEAIARRRSAARRMSSVITGGRPPWLPVRAAEFLRIA
ncbi:hypothetical protein VR43_26650 [Streptomyces sp. NRRL S-104]|nr:hypothetical protein VR43_26650 [Streptomyces sp. NRRL S-104]